MGGGGGCIAQSHSSHPVAPGLIPSVPKKISEVKFFEVAEVNQRRWLEESGQCLENVDWTHLDLANDKPVLEKERLSNHSLRLIRRKKGDLLFLTKLVKIGHAGKKTFGKFRRWHSWAKWGIDGPINRSSLLGLGLNPGRESQVRGNKSSDAVQNGRVAG